MKMILWKNKRSQAAEHRIYVYQDSKLLAPVVFFAELVYGPLEQSNVYRTLDFCPD